MGYGPGSWAFYSDSDSRWNQSGHSDVMSAMYSIEAETAFAEMKKTLGEPPLDLSLTLMKD